MGLIVMPILLVVIFFYIWLYKTLRKKSFKAVTALIITLTATLPFTYDILITNLLSGYYCLIAPPHPKTKIIKKVKYPISIYWEDNVYPGFSKADRELMIMNYLDGVHLKTMALNGDDGKIYVYRAKEGEYKAMGYKERDYAKMILKRGEIYTKQSMPKTNYTVTFNEIKLNSFARHFLYSDETKVIENKTGKTIAYNRRYMRFFYNILPDIEVGGRYYCSAMCGERVPHLEYKVFNAYKWTGLRFGNHSRNLHEILIKRYKGIR